MLMFMQMQMQCNYGAKHLRCYIDSVGTPSVDHALDGRDARREILPM
jgi:hypothetical protein